MTKHGPFAVVEAGWMTAEETMAELQIKRRTLQEWAQEGYLTYERRENPGKRSMRVYSADDVQKLSAAGGPPRRRTAQRPRPRTRRAETPLLTAPAGGTAAPAAAAGRFWLSLEEAAAVSGLSEGFLLTQIGASKLEAVKGGPNGAWRIRRVSLEQFPHAVESPEWRHALEKRLRQLETRQALAAPEGEQ